MSSFAIHVDALTAPNANGIPGVSIAVLNASGETLLQKTDGVTSLSRNASPITDKSIFRLSSSTKIITAIAALQCVERSQITLDEPVTPWLPELKGKQIISLASSTPATYGTTATLNSRPEFIFTDAKTEITLRMLLTHTSGIGLDLLHPTLRAWRSSRNEAPQAITGSATASWDMPLIFEPGSSWMYSASYDAIGVLISRLNHTNLEDYMQQHIFAPLDLHNSTFFIKHKDKHEMLENLVECVTRTKGGILTPYPSPTDDNPAEAQGSGGLFTSIPDFTTILHDLISTHSILLKTETIHHLFTPQLQPSTAQKQGFDQARPLWSSLIGELAQTTETDFGLGGLLVTSDSKSLGAVKGTLCWAGATGTFWMVNRERGVVAVCAMQIFPVSDTVALGLMQDFVREVWRVC